MRFLTALNVLKPDQSFVYIFTLNLSKALFSNYTQIEYHLADSQRHETFLFLHLRLIRCF